jgi:hypothetical protein
MLILFNLRIKDVCYLAVLVSHNWPSALMFPYFFISQVMCPISLFFLGSTVSLLLHQIKRWTAHGVATIIVFRWMMPSLILTPAVASGAVKFFKEKGGGMQISHCLHPEFWSWNQSFIAIRILLGSRPFSKISHDLFCSSFWWTDEDDWTTESSSSI